MAVAQATSAPDIAPPHDLDEYLGVANRNNPREEERKRCAESHPGTALEPPPRVPDIANPDGHGSGILCLGVAYESDLYPGNTNCKNPRVGNRRRCKECEKIWARYRSRRNIAKRRGVKGRDRGVKGSHRDRENRARCLNRVKAALSTCKTRIATNEASIANNQAAIAHNQASISMLREELLKHMSVLMTK
jgi:hypothetical protein